jgi:peptide chain release factor 2
MQEIIDKLGDLKSVIDSAVKTIGLVGIKKEINELNLKISDNNFWDNKEEALEKTKQLSKLKSKAEPWEKLQKSVNEAYELALLKDESLTDELVKQLKKYEQEFNHQKLELMFKEKYDDHDAIVSIFAGAGGTDAQDWAEMLLRMYLRYCEKSKFKINVIEQSNGEEAGIKSVTFDIEGTMVYGKLKGENGVHRLVRLSPFNADNLRQTSFARVEVVPKIEKPSEIAIDDKDIKTDVFRAGGHGGQSVNTTDSAVRITHLPTNLSVTIQNERSQLQNKESAMIILRSKLAKLQQDQHQERLSDLKGPNEQAAWGNQIRNYVLHPYNLVKDLRSNYETSNVQSVLNGQLDDFIQAYLEHNLSKT